MSQLEAVVQLQACPGQLHGRTPPLGAVSTCRVTRDSFSQGSVNWACCDRDFGRAVSSLKEKKGRLFYMRIQLWGVTERSVRLQLSTGLSEVALGGGSFRDACARLALDPVHLR